MDIPSLFYIEVALLTWIAAMLTIIAFTGGL